MEISQTDYWG